MAHPNGRGGWTISNDEAAEVIRKSGGALLVTVILKGRPESFDTVPPRFMGVAANEEAAMRWIQEEIDRTTKVGTAKLHIDAGLFQLKEVEVHE